MVWSVKIILYVFEKAINLGLNNKHHVWLTRALLEPEDSLVCGSGCHKDRVPSMRRGSPSSQSVWLGFVWEKLSDGRNKQTEKSYLFVIKLLIINNIQILIQ